MIRTTLLITGTVVLAACAPVDPESRADPALAGPAVKVVGEAQNCIRTNDIRDTHVHSDQVVDFEMRGGKIYRSVLPSSCPRLGFEEAFTYRTSINQLCTQDVIYVLQQFGGGLQRAAGCSLGEFVPVEYLDVKSEG